MKNLFVSFLLTLCLIGCKPSTPTTTEIYRGAPAVQASAVTASDLQTMVTYLASDDLAGRNTGTEGIDASASFIEKELKSYGVKPYFDSYKDQFTAKEKSAYNLVGFIEGTDSKLKNEIVILGAHYDHIGYGKTVENDSIANGANDNATGTSAVLAIAKHFATTKSNKRSIIVALFSAEEMGLLGSRHLASKLKAENIHLYTVVNIEMIGVPFKNRDYVAFATGYDKSNMAAKINEYVGYKLIGFSEVSKQYNLFKASDNYPFYETFKLPSHTISSCDLSNYDFYHKVGDEADQQDYNHMASLINKLIPGIEGICNTPTKEITLNE